MKLATITFCVRDGNVLLGMKKVRFGAGKWNGFGGKVDDGETIEEAASRELLEEANISTDPAALEKVAVISFYFGQKSVFECHAFLVREWEGEPSESDEMRPQWFPIKAIPYDDMWQSDTYWLPRVLSGEHVRGVCHFDEEGKEIVRCALESTG